MIYEERINTNSKIIKGAINIDNDNRKTIA